MRFRFITDRIGDALPAWLYCQLINLRCALRGRPFRLHPDPNAPYCFGEHDGLKIHLARRKRWKRYDKGIGRWLDHVAEGYCIHHVSLSKGDIVIDCGANIGEVGLWASRYGVFYHAFEPEEDEARCCDLNNYGGRAGTVRKALWTEETELTLYSKTDSADSSLIAFRNYQQAKQVSATTLAKAIEDLGAERIRLLKIDAEGAEPEVLQGAAGVFGKIDYVAIDCGFERGVDKEDTFVPTYDILTENGFTIVAANLLRPAFLYKRKGTS